MDARAGTDLLLRPLALAVVVLLGGLGAGSAGVETSVVLATTLVDLDGGREYLALPPHSDPSVFRILDRSQTSAAPGWTPSFTAAVVLVFVVWLRGWIPLPAPHRGAYANRDPPSVG